jgi:hypothetical protein
MIFEVLDTVPSQGNLTLGRLRLEQTALAFSRGRRWASHVLG